MALLLHFSFFNLCVWKFFFSKQSAHDVHETFNIQKGKNVFCKTCVMVFKNNPWDVWIGHEGSWSWLKNNYARVSNSSSNKPCMSIILRCTFAQLHIKEKVHHVYILFTKFWKARIANNDFVWLIYVNIINSITFPCGI